MSILIQKHYTSNVQQFVESLSFSNNEKLVILPQLKVLSSENVICFLEQDTQITGVLICKVQQINKKKYLSLIYTFSANENTAKNLIDALIDFYTNSDFNGILSTLIDSENICSKSAQKSLVKSSNFYLAKSSTLEHLSKSSSIEIIPFTKSNKREYSKIFTELLIDYDTQLFRDFNKSYNHPVFKSSISSSRDQKIRTSYFLDTLVTSDDLFSFLILNTDSSIIGFVKGKLTRASKLINTQFYLIEKYLNSYSEPSLQQFAKKIAKSADFVLTESPISNKPLIKVYSRFFKDPIGSSYSHF